MRLETENDIDQKLEELVHLMTIKRYLKLSKDIIHFKFLVSEPIN
jgi:hypothetical protein